MACLEKQKRAAVFLNPSSSWTMQLNDFTFLYLVFWLLLIQCDKAQSYSRITFCYNKNNYEGKRLNTTVLRHLNALSEFDCAAHCYHNSCCRSANFRKIPSEDGRENCELLHAVEPEEPENLQENETHDYLTMVQPQRAFDFACLPCKNNGSYDGNSKNCQCLPGFTGKRCETLGKNCRDIKNKGFDQGDGKYLIDPDGGSDDNAFQVYCDMTSFGGGWTMCYTTDEYVDIKNEVSSEVTYGINGYRANCNDIPFTEVMFVDENTTEKAYFSKTGSEITFNNNYNKDAITYGLWNGHGVVSDTIKYQFMICDIAFYKGIHVSGYSNSYKKLCYKKCNHWCSDSASPYFRTAVSFDSKRSRKFYGVAFNVNGRSKLSKRLISAGIR